MTEKAVRVKPRRLSKSRRKQIRRTKQMERKDRAAKSVSAIAPAQAA